MSAALVRLARWWRRQADAVDMEPIARPGAWTTRALLCGWGAPWPAGVSRFGELEPADQAAAGALFRGGAPAIAAAWREHGAWLEAEAVRLGLPRRWSHLAGPAFYAEFVSRNLTPGEDARDGGQHGSDNE